MDSDIASISLDTGGARDADHTTSGADVRADASDAVEDATADHAAAEGMDPSDGGDSSLNGLKQALLRTSPETPLSQIESPYDPENGGLARVYRGMQKALDFDGNPAIVDLVVGAIEAFQQFEPDGATSEAGESESNDFDDGLGMNL